MRCPLPVSTMVTNWPVPLHAIASPVTSCVPVLEYSPLKHIVAELSVPYSPALLPTQI